MIFLIPMPTVAGMVRDRAGLVAVMVVQAGGVKVYDVNSAAMYCYITSKAAALHLFKKTSPYCHLSSWSN